MKEYQGCLMIILLAIVFVLVVLALILTCDNCEPNTIHGSVIEIGKEERGEGIVRITFEVELWPNTPTVERSYLVDIRTPIVQEIVIGKWCNYTLRCQGIDASYRIIEEIECD